MVFEVRKEEIPNLFDKCSSILYIRSLLKHVTNDKKTRAWVDSTDSPKQIVFNNKMSSFIVGSPPDEVVELLEKIDDTAHIFVPNDQNNGDWEHILSKRWTDVTKLKRWAFSSDDLSIELIDSKIKAVSSGYELRQLNLSDIDLMDDEMGNIAIQSYGDLNIYFQKCIVYGLVDMSQKQLVSVCSGYPFIEGELEIDIVTRSGELYRRQGFASLVCLAFMKHSIGVGKIPTWDAANAISRDLALKLGFTSPIEYFTYLCKNP